MAGRLLLLLILGPIAELYVLIKVGSIIGALPTIALVILTAVVGSWLVKRQGLEVMSRVRESQMRGEVPALPVIDGAALLFAGMLLITPGLISDTLGLLLLIPKLRDRIARALLARVVILSPAGTPRRPGGHGDTIEGEYQRKSDASHRSDNDFLDHDHR